MIPRQLRLRNFLSYRDCTIDFSGLHVVLLTGKNGHGKSALLDAMTWATWGRGRGRREDDRIRLDADEMLVEFQFSVDGQEYLIVRKRSRGRSTGGLDFFQVGANGDRLSLSGTRLSETQETIIRTLHLDFDTFLNSAFIAQGRANEFTTSPPGDRKKVLGRILGLEIYDEVTAAARERRREVTALATTLEQRLDEESKKLEQRHELETLRQTARESLAELEPQLAEAEGEAGRLRGAAEAFETLLQALRDAEHAREQGQADLDATQAALAQVEADIAATAETVARGDAIDERYRALAAAREEESRLSSLQRQAREAERAVTEAEQAIATATARLESEVTSDKSLLQQHEEAAASVAVLREEASGIDDRKQQIDLLEAQIEAARLAEDERKAEAAERDAAVKGYLERAEELKAKQAQLEGVAICPVCNRPLSEEDSEHVRGEYARERKALGEQYRQAREEAQALKAQVTQMAAAREKSTALLLQTRRQVAKEELALRDRLARAEQASEQVTIVQKRLAARQEQLASGAFAQEARAGRADAAAALEAIAYDAAAHDAVRARIGELAGAEQEYQALQTARSRAGMLATRRNELNGEQERNAERVEAAASRVTEHRGRLSSAEDVRPQLAAAQERLDAHRSQRERLISQESRLATQLEALDELEARLETQRDAVRAYREEEGVFSELADAFGRNGIQAMLIDQAIPRIEDAANYQLEKMTGGRIYVSLSTQRLTQSDTVQETLDIRIRDELGERDYDLFSGGEAFRVDFALRVALAQLLAERAGASLPTLIIDEGFGTQDAEGVERLVEALNAVADQFTLILVVTHLEELKAQFDHRIEVTKSIGEGSVAQVVS